MPERRLNSAVLIITSVVLGIALLYLAWYGLTMVLAGSDSIARGMGIGVILLVAVGGWSLWATIKNGFDLQKISAAAKTEGIELDTTDLPRRPSGRVERDAADELFDTVSNEFLASPEDWRSHYRLARAYDYAGDRSRARESMRTALRLWSDQQ